MSEKNGLKKTNFTTNQIDFMKRHGINYKDLAEVYEKTDLLMRSKGWNKDYVFNDIGVMCEQILDVLADMEE